MSEAKNSSPHKNHSFRNRPVVLPVPSLFQEGDVAETSNEYINKKGFPMTEAEKQYHDYLTIIQDYKKRKPDYFVTLRAEGEAMWLGFNTETWTHLLHDFTDEIVHQFYLRNSKENASIPIIGCLEDTGGWHAHLMLWKDDTKRHMNDNEQMRKRLRKAFAEAVKNQTDYAQRFGTHRGFRSQRVAAEAANKINRGKSNAIHITRVQEAMFGGLETYISKDLWLSSNEPERFFANKFAHAIVKGRRL